MSINIILHHTYTTYTYVPVGSRGQMENTLYYSDDYLCHRLSPPNDRHPPKMTVNLEQPLTYLLDLDEQGKEYSTYYFYLVGIFSRSLKHQHWWCMYCAFLLHLVVSFKDRFSFLGLGSLFMLRCRYKRKVKGG